MKRFFAILLACLMVMLAFAEDHRMLSPMQKYGGKYGYVNPNGLFMISPKYDDARHFRQGFAAVEINGKWGFINPQGRMVVRCKYDFAMDFNRGYAIVMLDGKWGAVNAKGELEVPCEYESKDELLKLQIIHLSPDQVEQLKKLGY